MQPSEAQRILQEFDEDPRVRTLDQYRPPFSILRVLNVERDELVHSNLIAALLDPDQSTAADEAIPALLRRVIDALKEQERNGEADEFRLLLEDHLTDIRVHRERAFIDIIIEVGRDPGAVVGIENKIDALERKDQISDYQRELQRLYPRRAATMVFLTPDGRPPDTGDEKHPVPCVALGYRDVVGVADAAAAGDSEEFAGIRAFTRHVKEEIMQHVSISDQAHAIWQDH